MEAYPSLVIFGGYENIEKGIKYSKTLVET